MVRGTKFSLNILHLHKAWDCAGKYLIPSPHSQNERKDTKNAGQEILFAAFVPSCCVGLVDQFKNLSQKEIIYIDKASNGLQPIILYYWSIIQVGMIRVESREQIETEFGPTTVTRPTILYRARASKQVNCIHRVSGLFEEQSRLDEVRSKKQCRSCGPRQHHCLL